MSELALPLLVRPSLRNEAILSTIIPTAYWVSQGIDENTANGLERFQYQLVDWKAIYADVIYLNPATPNVDFIPHHDAMVPRWKMYAEILIGRGHPKDFYVEKIQLHNSVLDVIVPPLMQQVGELEELGLLECSIDRNGLLLISAFLSKNRTLKKLLLNENQIEDVDVARALSVALKNHPSMEELCLSQCGVGINKDVLPEILVGCKRLKKLRLNENKIRDVKHIGTFLARPIALTSLRLDKNFLSDADATSIAAALKSNTSLKYLYLGGNGFSGNGKKEITKSVFDPTSLNSLADCNHNCEVVYDTSAVASHINEKHWSTNRKVQSKILLALYGMSNKTPTLQYFRDVPLQLIPHGLELMQQELDCLEQHDAISVHMKNKPRLLLNRIYCFLRVWNMPWLFVNGVQQMPQKY